MSDLFSCLFPILHALVYRHLREAPQYVRFLKRVWEISPCWCPVGIFLLTCRLEVTLLTPNVMESVLLSFLSYPSCHILSYVFWPWLCHRLSLWNNNFFQMVIKTQDCSYLNILVQKLDLKSKLSKMKFLHSLLHIHFMID